MYKKICKYDGYKIIFTAVCRINDKFYIGAADEFNGLFRIEAKTGSCEFIGMFPGEALNQNHLFFSCCLSNGKVFFSPQKATCIHVYDIDRQNFETIPIRVKAARNYDNNIKFGDCFTYNGRVYIVGAHYPAIVVINPIWLSVRYIDIYSKESFYFRKGVLDEDKYYIASYSSSVFLELYLPTEKIIIRNVPDNFGGTWNIVKMEQEIFFSPRIFGEPYWKWNLISKKYESISNKIKGYSTRLKEATTDYTFLRNRIAYVIPQHANAVLRIDVEAGTIEKSSEYEELKGGECGYLFSDSDVIYIARKDPKKDLYDQETKVFCIRRSLGTIEPYEFRFNLNKRAFFKCHAEKHLKNFSIESQTSNLDDYIFDIKYTC